MKQFAEKEGKLKTLVDKYLDARKNENAAIRGIYKADRDMLK